MVDILSCKPSFFIGDNTAEEKQLSIVSNVVDRWVYKLNTIGIKKTLVQPSDNWTLKGISVYMPHLYAVGRNPLQVSISTRNLGLLTQENYWFGVQSKIDIYQENVEIDYNQFVDFSSNTVGNENLPIEVNLIGKISQINAPDVLNGEELYPTVFLRIEHTLPLLEYIP